MAACEEARQELLDDVVLADDDLGDLGLEACIVMGERGGGGKVAVGGFGQRVRSSAGGQGTSRSWRGASGLGPR